MNIAVSDAKRRRTVVRWAGLLALGAALLLLPGCQFHTPSFENPLDPDVSVSLATVPFDDPDFALLVAENAQGPNTNDVTEVRGWDHPEIGSVGGIEYLSNLVYFELWNSSVSSLAPLTQLKKLESLNIGDSNVTDVAPLAEVRSLRTAWLRENSIPDLTPLSSLPDLEELAISGPENGTGKYFTGDLSQVAALTRLRWVELESFGFSQVSEIASILSMPNLDSLVLESNQFTEIPVDPAIQNLRYLNFSWNQITSLPSSPLSFPNLEELQLRGMNIPGADMTGLDNINAPNLRNLSLQNWVDDGFGGNGAPIRSIPDLNRYPLLEGIELWQSDLTDLNALAGLSQLRWVSVGQQVSGITDFSALATLNSLHQANLEYSGFTDADFQYLAGLPDLNGFSFHGNPGVTTMSGLASVDAWWAHTGELPNLTSINLSNIDHLGDFRIDDTHAGSAGALASVSGGASVRIEQLAIVRQSLTDCSAIGNLATLRRLDLSDNPITEGARELARLKNLDTLNLTNTSIPQEDIVFLIEALPNTAIFY